MARRESAAMRSRGQTRIHVATLRRQVQEARIDLATGVRRAGVGGDCQPLLRCQATRRRRATCRERRPAAIITSVAPLASHCPERRYCASGRRATPPLRTGSAARLAGRCRRPWRNQTAGGLGVSSVREAGRGDAKLPWRVRWQAGSYGQLRARATAAVGRLLPRRVAGQEEFVTTKQKYLERPEGKCAVTRRRGTV